MWVALAMHVWEHTAEPIPEPNLSGTWDETYTVIRPTDCLSERLNRET